MAKVWTSEELGVDVSDLDLDDMGDFFRAWNRCKQAKKELNRNWSTEACKRLGILFAEYNYGYHLLIRQDDVWIDFYPSTGKWRVRNSKKAGRGIRNMLRYIGISINEG